MNDLTRAELIERICLTDATYDCNQGNCSSSCDKCEDILNYLLDRYDAKVRADAIDECIKLVGGNTKTIVGIVFDNSIPIHDRALGRMAKNKLIEELVEQLEQLKEQKNV